MSRFDVHTKKSAPAALKAYMNLGQIFDESAYSPVERQVANLAVNSFNACDYCMGAHSVIARMNKVPEQAIDAIRDYVPIEDRRLEALRKITTKVTAERGWVSKQDVDEFEEAGFTKGQVLEVILTVSFKPLSNYVNHIATTPLDQAFHGSEWKPASQNVA